jgi:hypothetical protein
MKLWKVLGYIFVLLGTAVFFYGFFIGLTDAINPSSALIFSGSSDLSMDSFFSVLWASIGSWMILATIMFIIGGIGLIVGRSPKKDEIPPNQAINSRLDELERKMGQNFEVLSKRLEEIERKQNAGA